MNAAPDDSRFWLLRCPVTGNDLHWVSPEAFADYGVGAEFLKFGRMNGGLVDRSRSYFYPVFNDIYILLARYALFIGAGTDVRPPMSFDKQRVFDYYNEVEYQAVGDYHTFADAGKWVDFRPVARAYKHHALRRVQDFYTPGGTYFLDIASGPVGFPENLAMSDGFDYHVCVDISVKVLLQARANLAKAGKQGLFICGDITNIPLRADACDVVVSQHTVYHVHRDEQARAVNELYRVARPGGTLVIIYSWFYHSWLMNLSLHVVQLYRVARHFAGKAYVRLFPSRPRLYFYAHPPRWFRTTFPFGKDMEFHAWQSVNKYFLDLYVHPVLGGARLLRWLTRMEQKHSRLLGRIGEYAAIVVRKKKEL
ncbi:MAG TPA: class I SAM-dependent methyltransferase [Chitinophagaceae bacterium]|jgi:SAM-dependent methyltransferase|nr:class I SAM-dependent methyltransferase [Chitinophagaceae bacterium]